MGSMFAARLTAARKCGLMRAMDRNRSFFWKLFHTARPLGGLLLLIVAALLALWLRKGFIEPERIGTACEKAALWWCPLRQSLLFLTRFSVIGISALVLAVISWLADPRWHARSAHAALVMGGLGLLLYNATPASIAVVLALVALAYRRETPAEAA